MTFDECVEIILKMEGGFVNHPNDPGGATNFGISARAYPHLDIRCLTRDEAKEIYRRDYWMKFNTGKFPPWMRLPFFDACVNQGPHFAIMALQTALGVKVDGILGPKTILALGKVVDEKDVLHLFMKTRLKRYIGWKQWTVFGGGLAMRILEITFLNRV